MAQKKYKNLTGNELINIKGLLNRINRQIGLKGMFEIVDNMLGEKLLPDQIIPNTYYYINIKDISSIINKTVNHFDYTGAPKKKCTYAGGKKYFSFIPVLPDTLPKDINCIGVSDESGERIYLLGIVNNQNPPYLYINKGLWHITMPDITYYKIIRNKVTQNHGGRRSCYMEEVIDSENPIQGVTASFAQTDYADGLQRMSDPMVIDITNIKQYFGEYSLAKKQEQDRINSEIRKQKEILSTYQEIGRTTPSGEYWENDGKKIKQQIDNDPAAEWKYINLRSETSRNYGTKSGMDLIYCDKYKVYYTSIYDSSD